MRGWTSSNSVRANRHWQSGAKKTFDIVKDEWHKVGSGSNAFWMDTSYSGYYLGKPYGGVISPGMVTGFYYDNSTTKSYFVNRGVSAESAYRYKAYFYNQQIADIPAATKVLVIYTLLSLPEEIKGQTIRFALSQGGISLRQYTAENTFTTVLGTGATFEGITADKELTKYNGAGGTQYYCELKEGDSVTFTFTVDTAGSFNSIVAGNISLFSVGCDSAVTAGSWLWDLKVSVEA